MRTNLATVLDPSRRSNDARDFETALRRKIVGQDQAIEKVAEIYQMFLAGLNAPGRPVGNLLFLGPTGSGKTRVVEAVAEQVFEAVQAQRLYQITSEQYDTVIRERVDVMLARRNPVFPSLLDLSLRDRRVQS